MNTLAARIAALGFAAPLLLLSSARVEAGPAWPVQGRQGLVAAVFPPPKGAQRVPVGPSSFGEFLRQLPVRPAGTPVLLHNGEPKRRQDIHAAVLDIDTGSRDLQQCADAVMRLRGEFLWAGGRPKQACFISAAGKKLQFSGGSYPAFRRWLDTVYTWANTGSLRKQLIPVADPSKAEPGDVFVVGAGGGLPFGHAVLVVDVVQDAKGQRWLLLGQSYMPAQDIHILKNMHHPEHGTWFAARADGGMTTPEWQFAAGALRRFGSTECGR